MSFLEIFGWLGATAIITSYCLVSFGKIKANSISYQLLNVLGAIGIVGVSAAKSAWQPAVLNVIWAIIGGIALFRAQRSPK